VDCSIFPEVSSLTKWGLKLNNRTATQKGLWSLPCAWAFHFLDKEVAVRELQHRMEILIATCDAALRLTVAAKTCW
jgi:hypothetical protein